MPLLSLWVKVFASLIDDPLFAAICWFSPLLTGVWVLPLRRKSKNLKLAAHHHIFSSRVPLCRRVCARWRRTNTAEQQCLRPRLCVRPSGDSRVSGSGPSAPDGPSHWLPGSPGSQPLIDQGPGFSRPGGPRTYCCGLASGAFGASRGLWGRPAVTAQTIVSVLGQIPTHHLPASLTHTFTLTRGGGGRGVGGSRRGSSGHP